MVGGVWRGQRRRNRGRTTSEASGRGPELGGAGGRHGKRVTCALPRERRWWRSLEGGRQPERMVWGQCDLGEHFSSRVGA